MSWFHRKKDIRKQNAKNILIAVGLAFGVFIFVYLMQGGSIQVSSDAATPVCNRDCRRNGVEMGDMVCKNKLWTCKNGVCNGGTCQPYAAGQVELGGECNVQKTDDARRGVPIGPGQERLVCGAGLDCVNVATQNQGSIGFCCDAARSHPNCRNAAGRVVAPNP